MRTEDQNSTLGFPIFADDSAAIGTGKTGLTITATLAKNTGTASAVSPTITELGNGIYWVVPISAHRDTIGANVWQFAASGAVIAPVFERIRVAPTVPDNTSISAAAASAATAATQATAAATSAASADTKLSSGRMSRLDRLPDIVAGGAGGLALVGSEMGLTSSVLASLFSDTDTTALVNAIIARVESDLDGADLSTAAIAVAVRNEILNRVLSGNHETAGTVGKVLQFLDATVSGRMAAGNVTIGGYATGQDPATLLASTVTKVSSVDSLLAALTEVVSTVTRFKAAALSQAPTGGSGGAGGLTVEQAAQMNRIESQTAKLSGSPVTVNGNVKPGGQIALKHGDNHLVSLLNSVPVPVDDVGGSLHNLMAAVGVNNIGVAAIRGADPASRISGTVAALNYASNILTVTMEFTAAESQKGVVGPVYTYDVYRLDNPTRTYFSGKLTVTRDARP